MNSWWTYVNRWIFSTNAKDIAILYLLFGLVSGIIGSVFSFIIRMELSAPGSQFLSGNGQLYNVAISAHGILMIFLCDSVSLVYLLSNREFELVLHSIQRIANLNSKDEGDNSMLLNYYEPKLRKLARSSSSLKFLWSNLNWFKSKSCMSCIDSRLCSYRSSIRAFSLRRTDKMSTCVFATTSIGCWNMIEWKPKGIRWYTCGTG